MIRFPRPTTIWYIDPAVPEGLVRCVEAGILEWNEAFEPAGAEVVDPRSGEAIRSHINMYHGLPERMRWQLVSQVATANPEFPDRRAVARGARRGDPLRGVARADPRRGAAGQPARQLFGMDVEWDPHRMTRIHLLDSLVRIDAAPGGGVTRQ